jgi:hypothetical protein
VPFTPGRPADVRAVPVPGHRLDGHRRRRFTDLDLTVLQRPDQSTKRLRVALLLLAAPLLFAAVRLLIVLRDEYRRARDSTDLATAVRHANRD